MEEHGLWLTPLNFIAGISLLVISTSARYNIVKARLMEYMQGDNPCRIHVNGHLQRATLLKNSLVFLYLSVLFLISTSLITSIMHEHVLLFKVLLCFSVASIFIAVVMLIRESLISMEAVNNQLKAQLTKDLEKETYEPFF